MDTILIKRNSKGTLTRHVVSPKRCLTKCGTRIHVLNSHPDEPDIEGNVANCKNCYRLKDPSIKKARPARRGVNAATR